MSLVREAFTPPNCSERLKPPFSSVFRTRVSRTLTTVTGAGWAAAQNGMGAATQSTTAAAMTQRTMFPLPRSLEREHVAFFGLGLAAHHVGVNARDFGLAFAAHDLHPAFA